MWQSALTHFQWFLFPLYFRSMRGFSLTHLEKLLELLEVKLIKVCLIKEKEKRLGFPGFLNPSGLTTVSLHQFINHWSVFPTPALVSMEVSAHVFLLSLWFSLFANISPAFESVVCVGTSLLWQIKEALLVVY